MIYFTADTHFGHANIISYCDRPFADLKQMHSELIRNWNAFVAPQDEIYIVGDFAYTRDAEILLTAPKSSAILSQILERRIKAMTITVCRVAGKTHRQISIEATNVYAEALAAKHEDYGYNGNDWSGNPAGCEAFIRCISKPG